MMKKIKRSILAAVFLMAGCMCAAECGHAEQSQNSEQVASADEMVQAVDIVSDDMIPVYADSLNEGTYSIEVLSSSSMFKIAECQLTVADGSMTAAVMIDSDSYERLFLGTGMEAVEASEDQYITYEVDENGRQRYMVPVEALDCGIDCAAWSRRKEKWYDRTLVFSSSLLPLDAYREDYILTADQLDLQDGAYTVEVELAGGSGKTTVESPAVMTVEDGRVYAVITFSSSNYDYMVVNEEKYEQLNAEGNSVFEIPVTGFDWDMPVKADSTAMGLSHEIDYTLRFESASIQSKDKTMENGLADGIYTPDKFSWSGGSGRVEISCDEITVQDGETWAKVVFDSDAYDYVTVDGTQYSGSKENGTSVFEIPVELNKNNTITGMTTKMSAAHEITYEIYICLEQAEAEEEEGTAMLEASGRQYLIAAENAEIPAGIEKEVCVIREPLKCIYVASAELLEQIETLTGKEFDMTAEVTFVVGTEEIVDFREVVQSSCDLAILPESALTDTETVSGFETLGIPVMIDGSGDGASEEVRAEWTEVYQTLFDCGE